MSDAKMIKALREGGFRGRILTPGEPDYPEARRLFNAAIPNRASIIAYCHELNDVTVAVRSAREYGYHLVTRSGGHGINGYSVFLTPKSILIDLSNMNRVEVHLDGAEPWARVDAGARWRDVNRETLKHGLATPGGQYDQVGVAGFTLGGGYGYISRSHGLSIDNLRRVALIDAGGELLIADRNENPDLFWALRGGCGGNYGVALSFDLELSPMSEWVWGGQISWPLSQTAKVLDYYQDFFLTAPRELTMDLFSIGESVVVSGMYLGSVEEGKRVTEPLRTFNGAKDQMKKISYMMLQREPASRTPMGTTWKTGFVAGDRLPAEAVEVVHTFAGQGLERSPNSFCGLEILGGRINETPPEATAFVHREAIWNFDIFAYWDQADRQDRDRTLDWAGEFYAMMQPFLTGMVYQNYPNLDLPDWSWAYYGANYPRLLEVKKRYDPDHFFNYVQGVGWPRSSTNFSARLFAKDDPADGNAL